MRKQDLRKISRKSSEKGIAIVFVLGIMGLLMVIGLGFAASSMLDSKLAGNTVNRESSKMLARSAFERAYLLLRSNANTANIVSRPASGSTDHDFLWMLDLQQDHLPIGTVENSSGIYPAAPGAQDPVWQYVRSQDGKIVGRFAYKCYPLAGLLDPSVHYGKLASEGDSAAALHRFGTFEGEIDFRNALTQSAADIYKADVVKKSFDFLTKTENTPDWKYPYRFPSMKVFLDKLQVGNTPLTNLEAKIELNRNLSVRRYPSPEAFWIDVNNDGKQTVDEFFHRFNLARTDWDETKFDDVQELFGVAKANDPPAAAVDNAQKYTVSLSSGTHSGIQWLGIGGSNADVKGRSEWTPELRRRQIAANIIQYCRGGDKVTVSDADCTNEVDTTPANTGGYLENAPSYAGVGKHPLLNEGAIKLSVLGQVQAVDITNGAATPRWKYTWSYVPQLDIGAEIIDIFGIANKKNTRVYLKGTVEFEYADPNPDPAVTAPYDGNKFTYQIEYTTDPDKGFWTFRKEDWTSGSNFYGYSLNSGTDSNGLSVPCFWQKRELAPTEEKTFEMDGDDRTDEVKARLKIRNVKLKIESLVLKYEGSDGVYRSRDYARINFEKATAADAETLVEEQQYFWIGVQAQDPRVNHYSGDWGKVFSGKTSPDVMDGGGDLLADAGGVYTGTDGAKNVLAAFANVDSETLTEGPGATGDNVPRLSTAYIAQKPMRSLWELGTISRAEAFRTINLTKTRRHKNFADRSAYKEHAFHFDADDYLKGDGNILDQVKIHVLENAATDQDRTASYGKVNINSDSHGVLQALFQGVTLVDSGKTANEYFDPVQNDAAESGTLYDAAAFCLDHSGSNGIGDKCIACKIKKATAVSNENVRFMTRSDLLLERSPELMDRFVMNKDGSTEFSCDASMEQMIGKTINLMTAEKTSLLYVVTLGQTIKEVPAGTYYVDWTKDGSYSDAVPAVPAAGTFFTTTNLTDPALRIYRKLGYIRPVTFLEKLTDTSRRYKVFASASPIVETITKTAGTFAPGADKITGSCRMVTLLEWDHGTQKWKIRSVTYGE